MSTFILIHGMWHGGWCWERLTPLLRDAGHEMITMPNELAEILLELALK